MILQESLIDLYLSVKIRSNEEVSIYESTPHTTIDRHLHRGSFAEGAHQAVAGRLGNPGRVHTDID